MTTTDELMRLALDINRIFVEAADLPAGERDAMYTAAKAALRAAIEEVVRDAERYRWLREGRKGKGPVTSLRRAQFHPMPTRRDFKEQLPSQCSRARGG